MAAIQMKPTKILAGFRFQWRQFSVWDNAGTIADRLIHSKNKKVPYGLFWNIQFDENSKKVLSLDSEDLMYHFEINQETIIVTKKINYIEGSIIDNFFDLCEGISSSLDPFIEFNLYNRIGSIVYFDVATEYENFTKQIDKNLLKFHINGIPTDLNFRIAFKKNAEKANINHNTEETHRNIIIDFKEKTENNTNEVKLFVDSQIYYNTKKLGTSSEFQKLSKFVKRNINEDLIVFINQIDGKR